MSLYAYARLLQFMTKHPAIPYYSVMTTIVHMVILPEVTPVSIIKQESWQIWMSCSDVKNYSGVDLA